MTLKSKVIQMVNEDVAGRGQEWLLGLGYQECNDYAEITKNRLQQTTGRYVRFESVARYIREIKEIMHNSCQK